MQNFEVSILSRNASYAKISWTASSGEDVVYDVELAGKLVELEQHIYAQNLSGLKLEIPGLKPSQTYKGRVIARDKDGRQIEAAFEIGALDQQLYMTGAYDSGWIKTASDGSGNLSWKTTEAFLQCIPAISGDTIFIAGERKALALSCETGRTIWNRSASLGQSAVSLLAYKGKLILPNTTQLDILNSADGSLAWSLDLPDYTEPFISKGTLYTSDNQTVYAYDIHSGVKRWQFSAAGKASCMLVQNEVVYFIGQEGNFYALNAKDGTLKWQSGFDGTVEISGHMSPRPSIIGDNVYFISSDNSYYFYLKTFTVRALNKHSGAELWSRNVGTHLGTSMMPHPHFGLLVSAGELWQLGPETGAQKYVAPSKNYRFTATENQLFYHTSLNSLNLLMLDINDQGNYPSSFVMPNGDGWWQLPVIVKNGKAYYPSECAMNLIE